MSLDKKQKEWPAALPMLPIRDTVIFHFMVLPLYIARDSSVKAIEKALENDGFVFLASQKNYAEENPTPDSIYSVGTVAEIKRVRNLTDGKIKILIEGISRARITHYDQTNPFIQVKIEKLDDLTPSGAPAEIEALVRTSKELIERLIAMGRRLNPDILLMIDDMKEPGRIADIVASNLGVKVEDTQKIYEILDPKERLAAVNGLLNSELEVMQLQQKMRTGKEDSNRTNREYILREQMKAIKSELGEGGDAKSEEIEELREKVLRAKMPQHVETEALKQLSRLEKMHPDASEASMLRTYLDWMVDLPWSKKSEDVLDLKNAKSVLDHDHYDLEKSKERVLEFLAVRKLKTNLKGPILCFGGPPGVGKTSLGRSIARAMGREYFRISLGGVKDEAEIRGHRRTYVGAMPGKIIQALRQVKTNNPVIVLDEIDKLGSDFRGDPSAAMLEVLDPEQNSTFRDNYLNVDFDLSNVLFIATANVLENIPPALRDRMEIINIPGYTENDKLIITKTHIIPKQIEANGIKPENVTFLDDGIKFLIGGYTREAGLRNLEREVGSICRKVAKAVVMEEKSHFNVDALAVAELLGPPRFLRDDRISEPTVGVVHGLAWTQAGGEVLLVEALKMKGKGALQLTGQLGDVMKESAQAAMSYARAHLGELGINPDFFEKFDIHVHLPAGAIPKDGPSAGVTLATALVSLMTDTCVRHDIAMTGEVTLQGRVLPVGGIREKALAALNLGITDVLIPIANEKDLADIPSVFKEMMRFHLVESLDDVFEIAFEKGSNKSRQKLGPRREDKKANKLPSAAA